MSQTNSHLPPVAEPIHSEGILAHLTRGDDPALGAEAGRPTSGVTVVVCTYRRANSLERFIGSLETQHPSPEILLIVDASPDGETEEMVISYHAIEKLVKRVEYWRVGEVCRGLTLQRNFALTKVRTDLAVFFDDDIVLLPGCLPAMEKAIRSAGIGVAAVSARAVNEMSTPNTLWRLRRVLRMVPHLVPGTYHASGMSIPWGFLPDADETVEGEYLPGGMTMVWSELASKVGFFRGFGGYAQGEDLDFSLRLRKHGILVLAGSARVQHLHEPISRPSRYRMGYMAIFNRFVIHRRCVSPRGWKSILWFWYTWGLDTLLLFRFIPFPRRFLGAMQELSGRCVGVAHLLKQRVFRTANDETDPRG